MLQKFLLNLAKLIAWFIHILPEGVKNLVGDFIGILWFDIFRIRRKLSINNTKYAFPNYTKRERISLVRKSLQNMGRAFMKYFSMPFINEINIDKYFEIHGKENIDKALEQKRGVMILSLHMGAYDFAAIALANKFHPFYIISKHFNWQWLNKIWFGLRESKGIDFIAERKSSFDILRALKKNALICFIVDQYMGPPIGVRSTFFGKTTGSPMGLAVFAMKTRSPVIPIYTLLENGKTKIYCEPEIVFEEGETKDQTVLHMTEKYNRWLEKVILNRPEQWMWVHNRWKTFNG